MKHVVNFIWALFLTLVYIVAIPSGYILYFIWNLKPMDKSWLITKAHSYDFYPYAKLNAGNIRYYKTPFHAIWNLKWK